MCILFVCLYVQMEKTNTTASNFQTINSQSIGCEMKLPISLTSTNRTKTKMKNWSNDLQPNSIFLGTQSIAASKFGWGTERRQISSVCCLCSFYWREHSSRSRRQHCSNRNSNNKTPPLIASPSSLSIHSWASFFYLHSHSTMCTRLNAPSSSALMRRFGQLVVGTSTCDSWFMTTKYIGRNLSMWRWRRLRTKLLLTSSYSDWKPLDHD